MECLSYCIAEQINLFKVEERLKQEDGFIWERSRNTMQVISSDGAQIFYIFKNGTIVTWNYKRYQAKKLIKLIKSLENYDPRVSTGGNVRDVIMTRLSASICYNSENRDVFVSYEPKIPDSYLRYLFGKELPKRTYRMQSMPLPLEFESLIDILEINYQKAMQKYQNSL